MCLLVQSKFAIAKVLVAGAGCNVDDKTYHTTHSYQLNHVEITSPDL